MRLSRANTREVSRHAYVGTKENKAQRQGEFIGAHFTRLKAIKCLSITFFSQVVRWVGRMSLTGWCTSGLRDEHVTNVRISSQSEDLSLCWCWSNSLDCLYLLFEEVIHRGCCFKSISSLTPRCFFCFCDVLDPSKSRPQSAATLLLTPHTLCCGRVDFSAQLDCLLAIACATFMCSFLFKCSSNNGWIQFFEHV